MSSYVYVIQEDCGCDSIGSIKVGKAVDINKRLVSLQVGNPRKLNAIRWIGPYSEERSYLVEKSIHNLIAKYRISGEWFEHEALEIIDSAETGDIKIYGIFAQDINRPNDNCDNVPKPVVYQTIYSTTKNERLQSMRKEALIQLSDAWVNASVDRDDIHLLVGSHIHGVIKFDEDARQHDHNNENTIVCSSMGTIPKCVSWAMESQERYMQEQAKIA